MNCNENTPSVQPCVFPSARGTNDLAAGSGSCRTMRNGVFLSTDQVAPELRTEVWREITRSVFDTTQTPDGDAPGLEGSVASLPLGSLLVGPSSFNDQLYRRDRRLILETSLDNYMVQLMVSGGIEGDCDGRSIAAAPGDVCVFDLARPLTARARSGSTIAVMLPRALVDRASGGQALHGTVLKAGLPATRLVAEFMVSLSDVAHELDVTEAAAIEEAAVAFLSSSLARQAASPDPMLSQVMRRRVIEFIDANLGDPKLDPALLMQRFRVSRAHLYRMFAADGGVAGVIRDRRLDGAYRMLMRPGAHSITELAYGFGFSGSGQFLKAFKARFAMTPSDVRRERPASILGDEPLAALHRQFALYAQQLSVPERR